MNLDSKTSPERLLIILVTLVFLTNLVFIATCVISAWPEYWKHINYEKSHLTWFSSIQLIFISLTAFSIFYLKTISSNTSKALVHRLLWLSLGCGFIFLSLDEKFQIHERLREGFFKPHNVGTNIPGIGAGDFLHLFFAIFGLFLSFYIFQEIKHLRWSRNFFLFAIVISLYSVISDATGGIPDYFVSTEALMTFRKHQFFEEIAETMAQMFFLASFTILRRDLIRKRVNE